MSALRLLESPGSGLGRSLPHSLEAEEYLLSTCLLDGADVLPRCQAAKIAPDSFYDPKHGVIFARLLAMHARRVPIDIGTLAEEMKSERELDQVGGYAFLSQVSSRIPTTAQSSFWIEKVREQALLRDIIRQSTSEVEDCYGFSGDIDSLLTAHRRRRDAIVDNFSRGISHEMPWDTLLSFDRNSDPDCLMGKRFLGRSGAAVIVAPSGVGKSVLALQLAACSALGRSFFGLQIHAPLRVLYVQAEDDLGDVGEAVQGFVEADGTPPDELAELKLRMRIVRWNDAAGDKFLARLKAEHGKWPFDLVVINPLFSFCGCNVSEQKELSPFLRNGLNPILNETRAAAIVVHHTNKPPGDDKKTKDIDEELRYIGSGSAELTNWARAYITLKGVTGAPDGVHRMTFAKRGKRAGLVDDNGQPTTKVFIQHSRRGLCWLPSDYRPDTAPDGRYQTRFNYDKAAATYVPGRPWRENKEAIAKACGCSTKTVDRYKSTLDTACN